MKTIRIDFPFINRKETANIKNGRHPLAIASDRHKTKMLAKCYINLAINAYKIKTTYWGCIMNRYWFFKNSRPRDYDNFCAGTKYYTDSLVDCKLIKNDSNKHILIGDVFHFEGYENEKLVYALELIETEKEFAEVKEIRRKLFLNGV